MFFVDYRKVFVCVYHDSLWNVLRKLESQNFSMYSCKIYILYIYLLNVYVAHLKYIGKSQSSGRTWQYVLAPAWQRSEKMPYILSLFNMSFTHSFSLYILWLQEIKCGFKIGGGNINNLWYANNSPLIPGSGNRSWAQCKYEDKIIFNLKKSKLITGTAASHRYDDKDTEVIVSFCSFGWTIKNSTNTY